MNIEQYRYLWDGSSSGWALLQVGARETANTPRYLVFNIETQRVLLIDDDAVSAQVVEAMIAKDVRIITRDP